MSAERIGFIGVGAMGEPMCRNLVRKHDGPVTCYDLDPAPLQRLAADGARVASSLADLADGAELVFLSLPSGREVRSVCLGGGGLPSGWPPGARHRLCRRTGRPHPPGRHRRHAQRHGGR